MTRPKKKVRLYLVTVSVFYFQTLVFGYRKKKQFSCIFLDQKHFWLVEIKKKKLVILMMLKQDYILFYKSKMQIIIHS